MTPEQIKFFFEYTFPWLMALIVLIAVASLSLRRIPPRGGVQQRRHARKVTRIEAIYKRNRRRELNQWANRNRRRRIHEAMAASYEAERQARRQAKLKEGGDKS